MKKIFTISGLGSIASIIALSFFLYYQFVYIEKIEIEVKTISYDELTKNPTERNLKAEYTYNGDTVSNLYKARFIISNIGTKTIIGESLKTDLIQNKITLHIDTVNKFKILDFKITKSNFPISLNNGNEDLFLKFQQWKVNEFIEITAYFESVNKATDTTANLLLIDEREIIDGKINYTIYNPTEKLEDRKIIDFLPKKMKNFFWWSAIITYFILIILTIFGLKSEFKKPDYISSKGTKIFVVIFMLIFMLFAILPILWMINI